MRLIKQNPHLISNICEPPHLKPFIKQTLQRNKLPFGFAINIGFDGVDKVLLGLPPHKHIIGEYHALLEQPVLRFEPRQQSNLESLLPDEYGLCGVPYRPE